MVQMYTIAGRQIGSHYLAMAILGSVGGLAMMATGGSSAKKTQTPPINASSSDEEKYIKEFLAQADSSEKQGNAQPAKK